VFPLPATLAKLNAACALTFSIGKSFEFPMSEMSPKSSPENETSNVVSDLKLGLDFQQRRMDNEGDDTGVLRAGCESDNCLPTRAVEHEIRIRRWPGG
jgi:hypothetical protein